MTRYLEDLQAPILHLLVWSAVAEFLFLRIFLRLGPVLPVQEPLLPLYRGIETLGLAALNLAFLTACVHLLTATLRLGAVPHTRPAAAVLLLAMGTNAGLGLILGLAPGGLVTALQGIISVAALLSLAMSGALGSQRASGRLAIGLVVAAVGLAFLQAAGQGGTSLGLPLPATTLPILSAEAMAAAAAIALPWSFGYRPGRRLVAVGAGLSLALLLALLLRPWILSTVAMWTIGFSLGLPGALYVLALGVAVATFPALWRAGGPKGIAAGLLLIALAGLKLDYSYFALLALSGVTLLCHPLAQAAPSRRPSSLPRPEAVPTVA